MKAMSTKLRGTKRVRFNVQLDHTDSQRIKRQARERGVTQADLLRTAIDLLEIDWRNQQEFKALAAQEHHENGDGV